MLTTPHNQSPVATAPEVRSNARHDQLLMNAAPPPPSMSSGPVTATPASPSSESASFLNTAPVGIAGALAQELKANAAQTPVASDTADWSRVPPKVASLEPGTCLLTAAHLLPETDAGVAVAFIGQTIVVAYPTRPTQADLRTSSRRSGREVRPVIVTDPAAFTALRTWATTDRPLPLLLEDAVAMLLTTGNGSDLHLTVGQKPWMRVGGEFAEHSSHRFICEQDMLNLVDEGFSGFDLEAFDGDLDYSFSAGGERWRANLAFERNHLVLALRRIPSDIPNARDLGVPAQFMSANTLKQGLVIVAGPTGSGKSTTLAALVDSINAMRDEHILSIEKPIEFVHTNKKSKITQREVGLDTATMLSGIKSALRQDPDVILVGEARDYEEISGALTLAETGHLVLLTLHARSAEGVINRIIDVFPSVQQNQVRTQLAGVLRTVMIQMLLPDAENPRKRHLGFELMTVDEPMRAIIASGESAKVGSEVLSSKNQIAFEETVAKHVAAGRISEREGEASVDDRAFFTARVKHHRNQNPEPLEPPT